MVCRDLRVARNIGALNPRTVRRTKPPANNVIRIDRITDEMWRVPVNGFLESSPAVLVSIPRARNVALRAIVSSCNRNNIGGN